MKKRIYIPPSITSVYFHAEKGYALSLPVEQSINPIDNYIELMMFDDADNNHYRETEAFIEHDDWSSSNPNSFWQ